MFFIAFGVYPVISVLKLSVCERYWFWTNWFCKIEL